MIMALKACSSKRAAIAWCLCVKEARVSPLFYKETLHITLFHSDGSFSFICAVKSSMIVAHMATQI